MLLERDRIKLLRSHRPRIRDQAAGVLAVVAERPSEVAARRYYEPSDHGAEAEVKRRHEALWGPQGGDLHEAEQGPGRDPDGGDASA